MKGINRLIQSIYFQQMVFWIISFITLHRLFTIDYDNGWADILFTLIFHIPLLIIVYVNFYSIRKTITRKFYGLYLLIFLFLVFTGWVSFRYGFDLITDAIVPQYYFTIFYTDGELLQFVMAYLILSFLLLMTRNWFRMKEESAILEKEHHRANLHLLKSQINPHFLLNSLNNIYSISGGNPKTREYLLRLSDGLKYMTYETSEDLVLLEDELEYLDNYIELEKLRIQNPSNVGLKIQGDIEGYLIPPLLLLPFVENCFKHSSRSNPDIQIEIDIKDDHLEMETINSTDPHPKPKGGLGIDNVQKRLDLIYKDQYQLLQKKKDDTYQVNLKINLEYHGI